MGECITVDSRLFPPMISFRGHNISDFSCWCAPTMFFVCFFSIPCFLFFKFFKINTIHSIEIILKKTQAIIWVNMVKVDKKNRQSQHSNPKNSYLALHVYLSVRKPCHSQYWNRTHPGWTRSHCSFVHNAGRSDHNGSLCCYIQSGGFRLL